MSGPRDRAGVLSERLRSAAQSGPEAVFARVGGGASAGLRVTALDALADHYAARLTEAELPEGARLLLLGSPEPRTLATMVGALRAGLDVALAPPSLDAASIAAAAESCGACILAGPAELAELRTGERLFEAAALLDTIILVALHGEAAPGAFALDAPLEGDAPVVPTGREPELLIADAKSGCRSVSQPRAAEVARAYIVRAGLAEGQAIVSTISLASEAGLVGGAFAPLIGGAHMIWQAPFSARDFLEALETSAPAHLFAPAAVASELADAGILAADRLASLTLTAPDDEPAPTSVRGVATTRTLVLRIDAEAGLRLE